MQRALLSKRKASLPIPCLSITLGDGCLLTEVFSLPSAAVVALAYEMENAAPRIDPYLGVARTGEASGLRVLRGLSARRAREKDEAEWQPCRQSKADPR